MPSRSTLISVGLLATWAAVVTSIAAADGFIVNDALPWRVIIGVAIPFAVFAGLYQLQSVRDYLLSLDPRLVIGIQLWRVIGVAFLFGWALDDLDASFAIPAGVGDVATGVAAAAALAAVLNGTLTRGRLALFTALGIGDFAVAVALGGFIVRPEALGELRWVLFPTLAVPFFAMAHTIAWIQLAGSSESMRTKPGFENLPGTPELEGAS